MIHFMSPKIIKTVKIILTYESVGFRATSSIIMAVNETKGNVGGNASDKVRVEQSHIK